MTERLTTIDLHMQALKFSAAHFTIFNAHERERLLLGFDHVSPL